MSEDWKIAKPGQSMADFDKATHEGHLLAAVGIEEQKDVSTKFGLTDSALCRYLVCIDDGLVLKNYPVFGAALVPRLVEGQAEGEIVAGRLGRGTAKAGQSAAWLLLDPSDEDLALVRKFFDDHAVRMPSGRIEIEPPAPTAPTDESF
jgi:hypothetical protein